MSTGNRVDVNQLREVEVSPVMFEFGIILGMVGCIFLIFGIFRLIAKIRGMRWYSESCEGKVVDIEWESIQHHDNRGRETSLSIIYYPVVEYLGCRVKDPVGYHESPEKGEKVTIKYNKNDIYDMYIQDVTNESLSGPIISIAIGAALLGFLGLCYLIIAL